METGSAIDLAPPLLDQYAPVRSELDAARHIFDRELRSELPIVRQCCGRLRGYRGKMIRPALLLLSGKTVGTLGDHHPTLAAVVEMVHVSTLVHDDVLDEADQRRGRPTIRAADGNVAAVLLGDYLISHAFHLCSSIKSQHASRRIGATTNTVCEGELLQNHLRRRIDLDESAYFDIVERKTGALTAVACELGAAFAGADEETVNAMRDFGLAVGVAFQIVDDILDVVGERREVGKTLGSDLALGKPTLPALHCLRNAEPRTADMLRHMLAGETPIDADRFRQCLRETDSITYARTVAEAFVARALARLDGQPSGDAKASLIALAEFITRRHF